MARPKPPEETDDIMVRPPISLADEIRELAALSNNGAGMSANKYCVAILAQAAREKIVVNERQIFDYSGTLTPAPARAAEGDPEEYTPTKRRA